MGRIFWFFVSIIAGIAAIAIGFYTLKNMGVIR
jgi:hypothetical protein